MFRMSSLPTRLDVIEALKKQKGKGRKAMEVEVAALKDKFPDLTDDLLNKILNDLLSYSDYFEEK